MFFDAQFHWPSNSFWYEPKFIRMQEIQVHSAFGLIQIVKLHWSASIQVSRSSRQCSCVQRWILGLEFVMRSLSRPDSFIYVLHATISSTSLLITSKKRPLRLMQKLNSILLFLLKCASAHVHFILYGWCVYVFQALPWRVPQVWFSCLFSSFNSYVVVCCWRCWCWFFSAFHVCTIELNRQEHGILIRQICTREHKLKRRFKNQLLYFCWEKE